MFRIADYLSTEEERKKAVADAQKERLERLERQIGATTAASSSSLVEIGANPTDAKAAEVGTKRRLEDTEYVEQSKEIVENVKSAVMAGELIFSFFDPHVLFLVPWSLTDASSCLGLLKKRKKAKVEPQASTSKSKGSDESASASVQKIVESPATVPLAAAAAVALAAASA